MGADYPGVRKRARWTVTDETVDPPELKSPDAMTVTYGLIGEEPTELTYPAAVEIVEDAEGTFHLDLDCPDRGKWGIRVAATEGVVAVAEEEWLVNRSLFPSS